MTTAAKTAVASPESVAEIIADYRQGEIARRTPDDVARWLRQFPEAARADILAETAHAMSRVYLSRAHCAARLAEMIASPKLTGGDPKRFWRSAHFLRIQRRGDSQQAVLRLFDKALRHLTWLGIDECGAPGGPYFYLDDCVFTGTHVRWDLIEWIRAAAPRSAEVHVLTLAAHDGYLAYTARKVAELAAAVGKAVAIRHWWYSLALASRRRSFVDTEVLEPRCLPDHDPHVKRLADHLGRQGKRLYLRTEPTTRGNGVFSGEARRYVLEQEFLKAGARIKYELCPHLKENHWPLGYDVAPGLGFGSMLVTYRNCPNNCPLALWVENGWFPLFPRKNNAPFPYDGEEADIPF